MGRKAKELSLGGKACHRMFKHLGIQVVDLFASNWTHKVPQYLSLDFSAKRASRGDALKERWPEGLMYAFPPPNIIQITLGRLVR